MRSVTGPVATDGFSPSSKVRPRETRSASEPSLRWTHRRSHLAIGCLETDEFQESQKSVARRADVAMTTFAACNTSVRRYVLAGARLARVDRANRGGGHAAVTTSLAVRRAGCSAHGRPRRAPNADRMHLR